MLTNNRLSIGNQRGQQGFTLIELSIVLVIIGLIAGGVLVGHDLIRAAEIRATISQLEKYNSAVHTFQGKYNGIPGDLNYTQAKAFGFFTFSSNPGGIGEGDGNGLIENSKGVCMCTPTASCSPAVTAAAQGVGGEQFVFWRHLSDANLVDGNFGANLSGNGGAQAFTTNVSQYFPPAKLGNNMYFVVASDGSYNYFALGVLLSVAKSPANPVLLASWATFQYFEGMPSAGLTPIDAYAIDTKLDDGMPNTGSVQALSVDWMPADSSALGYPASWQGTPFSGQGICTTGGNGGAQGNIDPTDIYNTNASTGGTEPACAMEFRFN